MRLVPWGLLLAVSSVAAGHAVATDVCVDGKSPAAAGGVLFVLSRRLHGAKWRLNLSRAKVMCLR